MRFYSWLRQNAEALITAIVLASAVLALPLVAAFYRPDEMLDAGTLSVAIFALLLTILNLNFAKRDIQAHVRPFLSVCRIQSSASVSSESTHFTLDSISIYLQNTGSIPAQRPQINSCLRYIDSGKIAWKDEKEIPSFAPNTQFSLDFSNLGPPEIQLMIYEGKMNLEICINYRGLAQNHRTKQTYKIQRSELPITAPNFTVFVFEPVEPTSFS